MLKVTDVAKSYGSVTVLDHISFVLNPGERLGLIGPNGAGKSTLLKIIAGSEHPDRGAIWRDPTDRLGYLAQALDLPLESSIMEAFADALGPTTQAVAEIERLGTAIATAHGAAYDAAMAAYANALEAADRLDAYTAPARLAAVRAGLALDMLDDATPVRLLSGGQKTRLGLARLLLTHPEVLLLDEPTNHLDLDALDWLAAFIRACPGAMLIVSHDRAFLDTVVTGILALDPDTHTLTAHPGTYTDYAEEAVRQRQRLQEDYRRQQERVADIKADIRAVASHAMGTERGTQNDFLRARSKKVAKTAKVRERKLEKRLDSEEHIEKPAQTWHMKLDFGPAPPSGTRVLRLDGVAKAFGAHMLFTGVSVDVHAGERIALVGPNGVGKTTLLRVIGSVLPPDAGSVRLGANVRVGYFAQEQEGLSPEATPLDLIRSATAISETDARTFLHLFLFAGDAVFSPVRALSYGERARLVLARLVVSGCNFLLLDEPLNHLDIPSRQQFEAALDQFGGTVLAVAHDRYFIARFARTLWALQGGHLVTYSGLDTYEHEMREA